MDNFVVEIFVFVFCFENDWKQAPNTQTLAVKPISDFVLFWGTENKNNSPNNLQTISVENLVNE